MRRAIRIRLNGYTGAPPMRADKWARPAVTPYPRPVLLDGVQRRVYDRRTFSRTIPELRYHMEISELTETPLQFQLVVAPITRIPSQRKCSSQCCWRGVSLLDEFGNTRIGDSRVA